MSETRVRLIVQILGGPQDGRRLTIGVPPGRATNGTVVRVEDVEYRLWRTAGTVYLVDKGADGLGK